MDQVENTVPHFCSSIVSVKTCLFGKPLLTKSSCIFAYLAAVAEQRVWILQCFSSASCEILLIECKHSLQTPSICVHSFTWETDVSAQQKTSRERNLSSFITCSKFGDEMKTILSQVLKADVDTSLLIHHIKRSQFYEFWYINSWLMAIFLSVRQKKKAEEFCLLGHNVV
jgi:hypothetical protein